MGNLAPHNDYLSIATKVGAAGLCGLVLVIVTSARRLSGIARRTSSIMIRVYSAACLACLVETAAKMLHSMQNCG